MFFVQALHAGTGGWDRVELSLGGNFEHSIYTMPYQAWMMNVILGVSSTVQISFLYQDHFSIGFYNRFGGGLFLYFSVIPLGIDLINLTGIEQKFGSYNKGKFLVIDYYFKMTKDFLFNSNSRWLSYIGLGGGLFIGYEVYSPRKDFSFTAGGSFDAGTVNTLSAAVEFRCKFNHMVSIR
jgi:hypothetical protein